MQTWQKIQIGIASSLIILGIGTGIAFKAKQSTYNSEMLKAQTTLDQKKKRLSTIQSDNEAFLLDQKQNNPATSDSIRQIMLNRVINKSSIKVAKALFNYTDSSDYLKRQNKVSVLLSKKATIDPALFPKHDLGQIKGQNIAGDYYSSSVTNGVEDSDGNVPVFLKVHYGTYLNDKLIATPTEGFSLTYNTQTGKFTSLKSVGKFVEKNEQ